MSSLSFLKDIPLLTTTPNKQTLLSLRHSVDDSGAIVVVLGATFLLPSSFSNPITIASLQESLRGIHQSIECRGTKKDSSSTSSDSSSSSSSSSVVILKDCSDFSLTGSFPIRSANEDIHIAYVLLQILTNIEQVLKDSKSLPLLIYHYTDPTSTESYRSANISEYVTSLQSFCQGYDFVKLVDDCEAALLARNTDALRQALEYGCAQRYKYNNKPTKPYLDDIATHRSCFPVQVPVWTADILATNDAVKDTRYRGDVAYLKYPLTPYQAYALARFMSLPQYAALCNATECWSLLIGAGWSSNDFFPWPASLAVVPVITDGETVPPELNPAANIGKTNALREGFLGQEGWILSVIRSLFSTAYLSYIINDTQGNAVVAQERYKSLLQRRGRPLVLLIQQHKDEGYDTAKAILLTTLKDKNFVPSATVFVGETKLKDKPDREDVNAWIEPIDSMDPDEVLRYQNDAESVWQMEQIETLNKQNNDTASNSNVSSSTTTSAAKTEVKAQTFYIPVPCESLRTVLYQAIESNAPRITEYLLADPKDGADPVISFNETIISNPKTKKGTNTPFTITKVETREAPVPEGVAKPAKPVMDTYTFIYQPAYSPIHAVCSASSNAATMLDTLKTSLRKLTAYQIVRNCATRTEITHLKLAKGTTALTIVSMVLDKTEKNKLLNLLFPVTLVSLMKDLRFQVSTNPGKGRWKLGVADALEEIQTRIHGNDALKADIAELIKSIVSDRTNFEHEFPGEIYSKNYGETPRWNLLLLGPPGTGKTTLAQMISKVYVAAGLFGNNIDPNESAFVEISGGSLKMSHANETEVKFRNYLEANPDKVIFFDEFYTIVDMHESVKKGVVEIILKSTDGLSKGNTELDKVSRHRSVMILAGYNDKNCNKFLGENEGLTRRFPVKLIVPEMKAQDVARVIVGKFRQGPSRFRLFFLPRQYEYNIDGYLQKADMYINGDAYDPEVMEPLTTKVKQYYEILEIGRKNASVAEPLLKACKSKWTEWCVELLLGRKALYPEDQAKLDQERNRREKLFANRLVPLAFIDYIWSGDSELPLNLECEIKLAEKEDSDFMETSNFGRTASVMRTNSRAVPPPPSVPTVDKGAKSNAGSGSNVNPMRTNSVNDNGNFALLPPPPPPEVVPDETEIQLKSEIATLQQEKLDAEGKVQTLTDNLTVLKKSLEKNNSDYAALQNDMQTKEQELLRLQQEVNGQLANYSKLESTMEQQQQELANARTDIAKLTGDMQNQREGLLKEKQEAVRVAEEERLKVAQQLQASQKIAESLQVEIATLRTLLEKAGPNGALNETVVREKIQKAVDEQTNELRNQVEQEKIKVQTISARLGQLQQDHEQNLVAARNEVRDEEQLKFSNLKDLSDKQLKKAIGDLNAANNKAQSLANEKTALSSQVQTLANEKSALAEQVEELAKQKTALAETVANVKNQEQNYKIAMDTKNQELAELRLQMDKLRLDNQKQSTQIADLEQTVNTQEQTIEYLVGTMLQMIMEPAVIIGIVVGITMLPSLAVIVGGLTVQQTLMLTIGAGVLAVAALIYFIYTKGLWAVLKAIWDFLISTLWKLLKHSPKLILIALLYLWCKARNHVGTFKMVADLIMLVWCLWTIGPVIRDIVVRKIKKFFGSFGSLWSKPEKVLDQITDKAAALVKKTN